MIPLIHKEIVEKKKWVTDEDVLNILAISESTPGVLAVNAATFVGYRMAGGFGALMATIGVVLPSFCIIVLLSFFIEAVKENRWIAYAFMGVRAGVVVLMAGAIQKLSRHCRKGAFNLIMMAATFLLAVTTSIDVVFILIFAAIIGIVKSRISVSKKEEAGG